MLLPDGTSADVTDLVLEGDTITATLAVVWRAGPKGSVVLNLTPSMTVSAYALTAPGMIRPGPAGPDPGKP